MRSKFTELIEQGIAKFEYTPIAPKTPEQDVICRMYNNIWSIPSDTHMFLDKDGTRYITGHMVGIQDRWDKFINACTWGAVNFRTTGYWCLADFLQKHGLCGSYGVLNGDNVYQVTACTPETLGPCSCPTCCTTNESQIPMQISTLTHSGNVLHIKECFNGKNNIYEVCEALNSHTFVKGNNWTVSGDKLICPIGNKIYIL